MSCTCPSTTILREFPVASFFNQYVQSPCIQVRHAATPADRSIKRSKFTGHHRHMKQSRLSHLMSNGYKKWANGIFLCHVTTRLLRGSARQRLKTNLTSFLYTYAVHTFESSVRSTALYVSMGRVML